MRSLRKACEESCGLPLALRDLVDEALSLGFRAAQAGHIGLGPGFIDEDQPPGVDEPLIGSPSFAVATYVVGDPARMRQGSFLTVTPIRRKKRLIIEVSALTSSLGRKAIARQSLKRDVSISRPARPPESPGAPSAWKPDGRRVDRALANAVPFNSLKPFGSLQIR